MSPAISPRSLLFMPGSRPEMAAKISRFRPDVAVLDLEDAVLPEAKPAARQAVVGVLAAGGFGASIVLVRVNPAGSTWFTDDLIAIAGVPGTGVVLPKYEDRADLGRIREVLGPDVPVVVGLETVRGVADCRDLLAARPDAMYFGAEDYIADIGGRRTDRGLEVLYARSRVCAAAALGQVPAIDQAVVAFRDDQRFRDDAALGRDIGYTGKICLHPRQVDLAHEVFTPSEEEIRHARAVVRASQDGVGVVDGQMVDAVHLRHAAAILARGSQPGGR